MDLKDFVAQSIVEICNGILEAKKQCTDVGLIISPPLDSEGCISKFKHSYQKPHYIHYDLNLSVNKNKEENGRGKFSINVANISLEIGKSGNEQKTSQTEQKMSFDIPVVWPSNYVQEEIKLGQKGAKAHYDPFC